MKGIAPQAAFIVVGPADMSTSIDGTYQTYPYLEAVRDAMKEAAFFEGCAYWDMYEVMGGYNSMVSWVNNSPAYAGPDYTHFTPIGARKMAELFYKAIHQEYEAWAAAKGL
jgi:lysophospholipase L1-like esterase